ncbi:hypothetical protein C8R44DRAFT_736349 [Mycena epipterygia]|nr:hypothetical protein C8R44DRAFT_736349 [Mycena epipterygia]
MSTELVWGMAGGPYLESRRRNKYSRRMCLEWAVLIERSSFSAFRPHNLDGQGQFISLTEVQRHPKMAANLIAIDAAVRYVILMFYPYHLSGVYSACRSPRATRGVFQTGEDVILNVTLTALTRWLKYPDGSRGTKERRRMRRSAPQKRTPPEKIALEIPQITSREYRRADSGLARRAFLRCDDTWMELQTDRGWAYRCPSLQRIGERQNNHYSEVWEWRPKCRRHTTPLSARAREGAEHPPSSLAASARRLSFSFLLQMAGRSAGERRVCLSCPAVFLRETCGDATRGWVSVHDPVDTGEYYSGKCPSARRQASGRVERAMASGRVRQRVGRVVLCPRSQCMMRPPGGAPYTSARVRWAHEPPDLPSGRAAGGAAAQRNEPRSRGSTIMAFI